MENPRISQWLKQLGLPAMVGLLCIGCGVNKSADAHRDPEAKVEITSHEPDTTCGSVKPDYNICIKKGDTYNGTDLYYGNNLKNPFVVKAGNVQSAKIFVQEGGYLGLGRCSNCTILNEGKVGIGTAEDSVILTTSQDPIDLIIDQNEDTKIELIKK